MGATKTGRTSSGAFTLLELLIVIAIISILAGLLLSALSGARDTAHVAVCRNNLRQCSLGMAMYVSDTGFFPNDGRETLEGGWIPKLLPYLKLEHLVASVSQSRQTLSNTVFSCPGFSRMPGAYRRYSSAAFGYNLYGSGLVNTTLVDSWGLVEYGNGQFWRPIRESAVVNPSQMIEMADCQIYADSASAAFVFGSPALLAIPWQTSGGDKFFERRHRRKKWNIAMVDGHVETQKGPDLFDFAKSAVRARWNRDALAH